MEETIKNELKQLREELKATRKLQAQGRLQEALSDVKATQAKLNQIQIENPEILELKSALFAELALIFQRLRNNPKALEFHLLAEKTSRRLPLEEEEGEKYRLQLSTTLINMTGLYAQQRMIEEGMEKAKEAIELLSNLSEKHEKASRMLRVGAFQNQASLFLEMRDFDNAKVIFRKLLVLGEDLIREGNVQLLPQLVEASGRLTTLLRSTREFSEASEVIERAEKWAENAYNAKHPAGNMLYVGTQLQLVDVRYAQLKLADAEDHLWKAIEIAGDGRTLTIGTGFYFMLMRHDENLLIEGELPKEEVMESLKEIMEQVEKAQDIPPELRRLLLGRQAAILKQDAQKAKQIYDDLLASQSRFPGVVQVLPLLKGDLKWLSDGCPTTPHISQIPLQNKPNIAQIPPPNKPLQKN